jgi:hypothetical protein
VDETSCVATVDVPPGTSLLIGAIGDCAERTARPASAQARSPLTFVRINGDHGTIERVEQEAVEMFAQYGSGTCAFVYGG